MRQKFVALLERDSSKTEIQKPSEDSFIWGCLQGKDYQRWIS